MRATIRSEKMAVMAWLTLASFPSRASAFLRTTISSPKSITRTRVSVFQSFNHYSAARSPFRNQCNTNLVSPNLSFVKAQCEVRNHRSLTTNLSSTMDHKETAIFEEDTIYALSSGGGASSATAVAVIRITGPKAHDALQVLLSKTKKDSYDHIKLPKPRYAALRTLYDPNDKPTASNKIRDPLDSSLVLLFSSPASFTGEDIVEIHCHGSRAVVQGILSALSNLSSPPYDMSIRPAERGEFTQRAYGSGKLGLVEVEALADLIVADTSTQRLQALRQLDGRLSELYEGWRQDLIKGMAHSEAVIDFGDDEDLDPDDGDDGGIGVWGAIRPKIQGLRKEMDRHMLDSQRGEILRDGVKVAIIGPPNAGKSSLLNLLSNREVAIVSPIAGTTRDVIEVTLDLGGVRCIVSDTAGVREEGSTEDIIEVEGIKRARKVASDAHIVVCMIDGVEEEKSLSVVNEVLSGCNVDDKKTLFLINKVDLIDLGEKGSAKSSKLEKVDDAYYVSCETNLGIDGFVDALTERAIQRISPTHKEDVEDSIIDGEGAVITRARHRQHVEAAAQALERFESRSSEGYMALDMAAEELRLAASELGRITGAVDVEDVLDVLFTDFCIGK